MAKQPDRVAIQGIPGAFHEIAAMEYFTDPIRVIPCETFADVIDSVDNLPVLQPGQPDLTGSGADRALA